MTRAEALDRLKSLASIYNKVYLTVKDTSKLKNEVGASTEKRKVSSITINKAAEAFRESVKIIKEFGFTDKELKKVFTEGGLTPSIKSKLLKELK